MKIPLSPSVLRAIQFGVLAALIVLLWQTFDGEAALAHLRTAEPIWLIAAGLILTLQTVLSAQRWRITAAQLGLDIAWFPALREYYLSQVVNQSLPGGVLGDASRAVRSRRQAGLMVAAQAVVFERIAGQLGLIAVLTVGLALTAIVPNAMVWPTWLIQTLSAVAAAAGLAAAFCIASPHVRTKARAFSTAIWSRDVRGRQIALSLGTALSNIVAFALCAVALDVAISAIAVLSLVPLILFAMILPLSIGGWGLREGAAALLFPVMGATAAQGLAVSVAFGLVLLVTVLPGFIFPLIRTKNAVPLQDTHYTEQNDVDPNTGRTSR